MTVLRECWNAATDEEKEDMITYVIGHAPTVETHVWHATNWYHGGGYYPKPDILVPSAVVRALDAAKIDLQELAGDLSGNSHDYKLCERCTFGDKKAKCLGDPITGKRKREWTRQRPTAPATESAIGGSLEGSSVSSSTGSTPIAGSVDRHLGVLYFDGGSLGNPGVGGAGYLLFPGCTVPPHEAGYASDAPPTQAAVRMDGVCTNNQAEYAGLIHGLHAAQRLGVRELYVFGDSELVVKQMRGEYRVKNPVLQDLYTRAAELSKKVGTVHFAWIDRQKNAHADALSKRAMNQKDSAEEAADWFRPS